MSYEHYQPGDYVLSQRAAAAGSPFGGSGSTFQFVNEDLPEQSRYPLLATAKEFDNPDLKARFPYRLLTPPNDRLLNSTFGERYAGDTGTVLIHPDDAGRLAVVDDALLRLVNLRGTVTRRARVSDDTQPGLLVAEGLYWPADDQSGTINDLTSQQCADSGGGAIFHESLVDIVPVPMDR